MKYMGSKARIAKDIAPLINNLILYNDVDTYIEPFVGGANMIEHIDCQSKIGSDNNEYLISMWNAIKNGWEIPREMSRDLYNDIKDNQNKYPKELVAIAGFCATYNAKWFGGYAGIVNTKIDTVRNYYDEAIRNIENQAEKIKDVEFLHKDYTYFTDVSDCLIYCDIPYRDTTKYGAGKDFDHDAFWDWAREMSHNNIILVSEYNAPKDFKCIYAKDLITTLDKNSRKIDTERLFIN